jgi:[ribosomal protein S18]-alanine N-acetyltransferase
MGVAVDRVHYGFRSISERDALAILGWRYAPPYDVYNHDPAEAEADLAVLLDPANGYYAITDEHDEPLGFCCFGPDARVPGGDYADDGSLDMGAGMRPDLTGRGTGGGFIATIVAFGQERYRPAAFRATVAAFNQRSIRACERAGFRQTARFRGVRGQEFVILSLPDWGITVGDKK